MKADEGTYGDKETERRREAAIKRMLNTPHKPHNESGKKRKKKTTQKGKS